MLPVNGDLLGSVSHAPGTAGSSASPPAQAPTRTGRGARGTRFLPITSPYPCRRGGVTRPGAGQELLWKPGVAATSTQGPPPPLP